MIETTTDPSPGAPSHHDGRFIRFWKTVPGLLTAVAAVLSAAVPLYLHLNNDEAAAPARAAPAVQPVIIDLGSSAIQRVERGNRAISDPVDACIAGNPMACAQVLAELEDGCDGRSGLDCDVLWEVSEAGSELEWFGATCGHRFETDIYAGECEQRI